MTHFVVLCDACVLYPAPIRDLLMELALNDLLQLKWSHKILDEWIENLLINRLDLSRERLEKTRNSMIEAILDCLVKDFDSVEASLNLPDPNDNHVLAAAIVSKSKFIITTNLKDFPDDYLALYNLKAYHPDNLFMLIAHKSRDKFLHSVSACHRKLKKPPKTLEQYLLNLKNTCGLVKTVDFLEANILNKTI